MYLFSDFIAFLILSSSIYKTLRKNLNPNPRNLFPTSTPPIRPCHTNHQLNGCCLSEKNILVHRYALFRNKRFVLNLMPQSRAFHTHSDLLGDLVKLSLYPTDKKSKIAAKSTASVFSTKSAYLGDVPAWTQASQAGSEEKTEAVDLAAILDF